MIVALQQWPLRYWPYDEGTEVFVARANFMPGACILTAAIYYAAIDGMAVIGVLKI